MRRPGHRRAAAGEQVRLSVEVSDTGVGVPPEQVQHLFDPFTQADSSTTRIYGGTGLGLAISREIVEAMGGTIDYAPNLGGGSVFTSTVCRPGRRRRHGTLRQRRPTAGPVSCWPGAGRWSSTTTPPTG